MVDAKRIFVFVLVGMFLVSMMGVVVGEDKFDPVDPAGELGGGEEEDVFIDSLTDAFKNFPGEKLKFTPIAEGLDDYKGWLYAVLLGMIIYTVISSFFSQSGPYIKWGISIAITAIAMIGIPPGLYNALEVQYGAMGSAILAVIPFAIILFFTMKVGSLLIARMTWLFFALYSLFMFWGRFVDAAPGSKWPYMIGFAATICMIVWIKWFRKKWFKGELDSQVEIAEKKAKIRSAGRRLEQGEAEDRLGRTAH